MVGQCLFCSWYGVRLRRAPYLDGRRPLYHVHCARVALHSPDPEDRARAEQIFRTELPRVLRTRFWEINPPNRTLSPFAAVRDLSADEFDRLCRTQLAGPGELLRHFAPDPSQPRLAAQSAAGELSGSGLGERAAWSGRQRALPPASSARRSVRTPAWTRPFPRERGAARTSVEDAVEMGLSAQELSDLRARLVARQAAGADSAAEEGTGTVAG